MPTAWLYFLASLTYGIPSVLLYIITMYIIVKHRKTFDSSFFNLYIYDGVINIFTYLNTFWLSRLSSITCGDCLFAPFYSAIGNFSGLNFFIAMGIHMAYVQYALTTLISLNRFSVLVNFHIEFLWKKYSWILIVLIYALPFLSTHIVFEYKVEIKYFNTTDNFRTYYPALLAGPLGSMYSVLIPFMLISIITSIVTNITSTCIIRQSSVQIKRKAELNFLIIMSITCAVQLFGTILSCFNFYYANTSLAATFLSIAPFVSDGLSLVQPWLLICLSSSVRERVKMMLCRRQKKVDSQVFSDEMPTAWLYFLASLTYGIPSVFLYIITMYIIVKHRKTFKSSFFNLYIYDGVINIFTYLNTFWLSRLSSITCGDCLFAPFYRAVGNSSGLNFFIAMGIHMAYVQYAVTTLFSLNRFSAANSYFIHGIERFWKKYSWILILLIYVLPFMSTHIVFLYNVEIKYFDDTDNFRTYYPALIRETMRMMLCWKLTKVDSQASFRVKPVSSS
ncbi:unnamed protein product [Caenorhabditis sp. 36 PRJEB53466]|nr:unnamed protein product [Caenorhabditis sp. 36 PRJEB53466]